VTAEPAAAPAGQQAPAPQATTEAPEGAKASSSEPAKVGAPDKYEFKAPDGQAFDAAVIEAYSAVAKELNLTQESAQKMLDRLGPVLADRQSQQMESMRANWLEAARADQEFGGAKLGENMAVAKKALDTFGSPALRELLNESGIGNHPEVVRFFFRAGKAISEDTFVGRSTGDKKTAAPKGFNDLASALYSSQGV
jgi:hypothetical protein